MNSDIRVAVSFKGHRKRKKLMKMLGPQGVLCLVDLWLGVAMSNPTGMLTAWDEQDIALEAGWEGSPDEFVSALLDCRFLDKGSDGTFKLHDWDDHQGYVVHAQERKDRARQAAEARWNKKISREKQDIDASRMQDASGEHAESNAPAPAPSPSPVPSPSPDPPPIGGNKRVQETDAFRPEWFEATLWDAFIANRKHKKLQNTGLALNRICGCIKEAIDGGFSLEDCVGEYVSGSWQKFNIEWMRNIQGKKEKSMSDMERQARELLGYGPRS